MSKLELMCNSNHIEDNRLMHAQTRYIFETSEELLQKRVKSLL